jgi:hypothetical protein
VVDGTRKFGLAAEELQSKAFLHLADRNSALVRSARQTARRIAPNAPTNLSV